MVDVRDIIKTLCNYNGGDCRGNNLYVCILPKIGVAEFMGYLRGKSARRGVYILYWGCDWWEDEGFQCWVKKCKDCLFGIFWSFKCSVVFYSENYIWNYVFYKRGEII